MLNRRDQAISGQALGLLLGLFVLCQFLLVPLLLFEPAALSLFLGSYVTLAFLMGLTEVLAKRDALSLTGIGVRSTKRKWTILAIPAAGIVLIGAGVLLSFLSADGAEGLRTFNSEIALTTSWWQLGLSFLTLCLLVPVVEELIFRGGLLSFLKDRMPAIIALGITSLLFALFHAGALGSVATWRDQALLLAGLSLVGLAAGAFRLASGSLYPAIVLHGVYNGLVFQGLYLSS